MITVIDKGLSNFVSISEVGHKSESSGIQIFGNNNRIIIELGVSFKNTRIIIRGSNNTVIIKRHSLFEGGAIVLFGDSVLNIGKRCSFGSRMEMGLDTATVTFGDNCMAAAGLMIRTTDSHGIYSIDTGALINKPKDIVIGDYVWFGRNVSILKGAVVGNCNIIGLDSIFTGKSNDFELWAGTPAKKIKEGVLWARSSGLKHISDDPYAKMYLDKYAANKSDDQ